MGLCPEASSSSPITSTPKLCPRGPRLFSFSDSASKSGGTVKSNDSKKSTSKNVQQLSTSWEYLR